MGGREPLRSDDFETIADGTAAVKVSSGSSSAPSAPSDPMMTVELGPDSPTLAGTPLRKPPPDLSADPSIFQPGFLLGQRYEILQILGQGGMGAVYKALDREVNRTVALKVIRPDLARNSSIIERFKQELVLSHQVTHRNVVRIYDLGDADGVKFITMEYIEGSDLRSLIKDKKAFPPGEAVEIMIQICRALEAAHGVGVIHRDLKPQNIMRDNQGRIIVMDFGLARLMEADGMTQTGALVGTMEYMSPEQALGGTLDQRSDLFTLGLIFYELLSGKMPFHADSALASLIKRTQERAIPVTQHDKNIPAVLASIVSKCMERDPKLRYQSASEMLIDLEAWQGKRAAATLHFPASEQPWGRTIPWHWIGGVAALLLLVGAGFLLRAKLSSSSDVAPAGPVVSVAILPLKNASGEASMNWMGGTIAEMLITDMGQSATLRTVASDRVAQVLHDLRVSPDVAMDPDTLRHVGEFTSADRVVWGQYIKLGDQIRIDATLRDLKQGRNVSLKAEAAGEKDLPRALQQLAESLEKNLNLPSESIKQLQASVLKPSTQSLQALRFYNDGVQLLRQGKFADAQKNFQSATEADTNFALAYAKLGNAYGYLGYAAEAEQATRKAVELSDNLPQAEKVLIAALHYYAINDTQKALQTYETVAKMLPQDPDIQFSLGDLYNTSGLFDKARTEYDNLLTRDPKNVEALNGRAGVEINAGNPQAALDYLNRALSITVELGNDQQQSRTLYALGVTYNQLNRPEEALRNYQNALAIQRRLGAKREIGLTLNGIGQIQAGLGKMDEAVKTYQEALQLRRDLGNKRDVGDTLIDLSNVYESRGQNEQALALLKESLQIQREVGNQTYEGLCLNLIGMNYADEGKYDDALTYLKQGEELREKLKDPADIGESNYALADALANLAQYDEALPHYMKALELWRKANDKRRAAYASNGLGNLFQHQGRLGAALDAKTEALKTIREVQDQAGMAEMLGAYGNTLALLGRDDEAEKSIVQGLNIARQIKNDSFIGRNLNYQGDALLYRGDLKGAAGHYQQALQVAMHTTDRRLTLTSKFNLAKVNVEEGRSREAISTLRSLSADADAAGLRYLSVEASTYLGEALLNMKDYAKAEEELNRALARSEKSGLKMLQARNHYLLGAALRLSGKSGESARQYAEAQRLLEEISKESKSDAFLKRSDISSMYSDSVKFSRNAA